MPGPLALTCALMLNITLAGTPTADSTSLLAAAEHSFQLGVQAKDQPDVARAHFQEAARNYARLHAEGVHSVGLYRSWGNTSLLAGNVPAAILAYRRGLHLAPSDADLHANLALARSRVDYPLGLQPPADDAWPGWLPRPGRPFFFAVTGLMYTLACLFISRWLLVRRSSLLVRAMLCLFFAILAGIAWYHLESRREEERLHPVVVIAADTPLYRGNGPSYPHHDEVPLLAPGIEARQLLSRGDWLQIELPGPHIGWVPRRDVLVDGR